jgi:hypothetical protein
MASVAVQPFSGTYRALREPSSCAFAVRHSSVFWYRDSLSDAAATPPGDGDAPALEGSARVEFSTQGANNARTDETLDGMRPRTLARGNIREVR